MFWYNPMEDADFDDPEYHLIVNAEYLSKFLEHPHTPAYADRECPVTVQMIRLDEDYFEVLLKFKFQDLINMERGQFFKSLETEAYPPVASRSVLDRSRVRFRDLDEMLTRHDDAGFYD